MRAQTMGIGVAVAGAPQASATQGFCGNAPAFYRRNIGSACGYTTTLSRVFTVFCPPRAMSFRGDGRVWLKPAFGRRFDQGWPGRFQPATIRYKTRGLRGAR
ncbi:MAG: hypothetical protein HY777_00730 [Betaproteobacteria bacterium]|nr:hypothetical protein [Betaproteobacteria bacterium]